MIVLSLLLLLPISIVFGPAVCPLFVVVGVEHIHAVLHSFAIFPAMKLAPLVIGSGIRARSGITKKKNGRHTGRVSRLRGSSLGRAAGRVVGYLLVIGTFLFKGCGEINQNLVVIGTLIVPFTSRHVGSIQVDHVRNEGTGVESGGILYLLAALALDNSEEIPGGFSQLVEGECKEPLLVLLDLVL